LPGDCARELFKPSKDAVSLLVCNEKKLEKKLRPKNKLTNYVIRDKLFILLFLSHNVCTRNARKPIKGSDSSLVSKKNFSQKIPSNVCWPKAR